jgi:preprotein translocase subunit SecA
VETYFYDIRKQLYDYDNVLNQQREKLYSERKRAMMAENLESLMVRLVGPTRSAPVCEG